MDLSNKVVLITGSSRGIGREIALAFAQKGCRLVLNGRSQLPADLAAKLQEMHVDYQFIPADLGDLASLSDFAQKAWDAYGRIDVLVNNAGINRDKLLIGMKAADLTEVVNVDLNGPIVLTSQLLKKMYKQKSGCIINMASVVGLMGNVGQANYAAAKGGLIAFTKSLAREAALRNIRANAIAPGMIVSDMTNRLSEKTKKELAARIPLGHFGRGRDVAQAALFLAESDYVTGQTIVVDGGMCM